MLTSLQLSDDIVATPGQLLHELVLCSRFIGRVLRRSPCRARPDQRRRHRRTHRQLQALSIYTSAIAVNMTNGTPLHRIPNNYATFGRQLWVVTATWHSWI